MRSCIAAVSLVVVLALGLSGVPDAGGQLLPGTLEVQVSKRAASTSLTPSLSATFSADRLSAIPGDSVTYTARVTNSGAKLKVSGRFTAKNAGAATARIESFFDDVEYHSILENRWVPLAGNASARTGYMPLKSAPITTGLELTSAAEPASGVTYPGSGDPFVDSRLAAGSTASWTYEAELELTASQIALLLDPLRVDAVRNVVHFEIAAEDGSGRDGETRAVGFTKQLRTQTGTARDVVVTESLPGGATRRFDKDTTPGLGSMAQGGSVTMTSSEPLVAPGTKGLSESDAAYLARLQAADGQAIAATVATAGSADGAGSEDPADSLAPLDVLLDAANDLIDDDTNQALLDLLLAREKDVVTGPQRTVVASEVETSVIRRVPIVTIEKSGPQSVGTAQTASYPLSLTNVGGAGATLATLTDRVGDGNATAVDGAPAMVAAGATATATATHAVAEDHTDANLSDTASVTWKDANNTSYGPLSDSFTTHVSPGVNVTRGLQTLALTPRLDFDISADRQSALPGDSVAFTGSVRNAGASLKLDGNFKATNTLGSTATVASFSDHLEYYSAEQDRWVALAGEARQRSGYTARVSPAIASGLTVTEAAQPASGVVYPEGSDKIIGARLQEGAQGSWDYEATVELTPLQVELLRDPQRVTAIRAVLRVESTSDGDSTIAGHSLKLSLLDRLRTQSGAARHVTATVQPPTGAPHSFDESTTPALASIASGQTVSLGDVSAQLPTVAAKGAQESDLEYWDRLEQVQQTPSEATGLAHATITGASRDGQTGVDPDREITSPQASVEISHKLPIVSVATVGPGGAGPGAHLDYEVTLANTGLASAQISQLRRRIDDGPETDLAGPASVGAGASASTTATYDVPEDHPAGDLRHTASVTWQDANGSTYGPVSDTQLTTIVQDATPAAPRLNTTTATSTDDVAQFLTTGPGAIQTGVTSGTIDRLRASLLRGRTTRVDGTPLSGVQITVPGHPELGTTTSRSDGGWYLAVNGGGPLVVRFSKSGYLTVERTASPNWQETERLDDVVLTEPDPAVSQVDLTDPLTAIQIARATLATDNDGTRQATLLFSRGTTATMTMPNGTTQPLTNLGVRATEFTVGANGEKAMPAEIAPGTGYTYAADFSVDEAAAAGASGVMFSKPVISYTENFLGFPVGGIVPAGYYDQTAHAWKPAPNGRVIRLLAINGGMADVDITGSGQPASSAELAALGVTDDERATLASLYETGQSLWRVPLTHFSRWDFNWPVRLAADAIAPVVKTIREIKDSPCPSSGSVIDCEDQSLGEDVALTGTGQGLHYRSNRQKGYRAAFTKTITVTPPGPLPSSLRDVKLSIDVAGQHHETVVPATADRKYTFAWDGRDAFGRRLQGSQPIIFRVGYRYYVDYAAPANAPNSFGEPSGTGASVVAGCTACDDERDTVTVWRDHTASIGTWDEHATGLGGWSLSAHHTYDPISRTLYQGDGSQRSVETIAPTIKAILGDGGGVWAGCTGLDGAPGTSVNLVSADNVAVAGDGNIYATSSYCGTVWRVDSAGKAHRYTGFATGAPPPNDGDGGPALAARLLYPNDLEIGPDGSVFIADAHRVRRVDPGGTITTVAGMAASGFAGDGGPATQAKFNNVRGIALGLDGSLYIADTFNHRIRRVTADGTVTTVAGTGQDGNSGDGGPATSATLASPHDVSVGEDGAMYIADRNNHSIRRVDIGGRITTLATPGIPASVRAARDGAIYFSDQRNNPSVDVIRRLGADGSNLPVVGSSYSPIRSPDGTPATSARLASSRGVDVHPDGAVIVTSENQHRVYRVSTPLPGLSRSDFSVPSEDGAQLHQFDTRGRHLRTLNTTTGSVIHTFAYDGAGRLTSITDANANTVTVNRGMTAAPTSLTSPYGQVTRLHTDANGLVDSITSPGDATTSITYSAEGALLKTFRAPGAATSTMTYDADGRLTQDDDGATGSKTLSRSELSNGYRVDLTTAMSRTTQHKVTNQADGSMQRVVTDPAGLSTTVTTRDDGTADAGSPDGSTVTTRRGPDPRFGMLTPLTSQLDTISGSTHLTTQQSATATLANPEDPLSMTASSVTTTVNGRQSTSSYTASTRRQTDTSAAGRVSTTDLDPQGRPVQTTVADITPSTTRYDTRGRVDRVQQGAREWTFGYDPLGRLDQSTDPLGRTTMLEYDADNRVTRQTLPGGAQINYGYDTAGNLASVTPAGRPAHTMTSNSLGLLTDYAPPSVGDGGQAIHYAYNADRQVTSVRRADGQEITFGYDSAGRPTTVAAGTSQVTTSYDPATGRVDSLTGPSGQTLSYDYSGSLRVSDMLTGTVAGAATRTFDDDFRIASSTVQGSAAVSYGYDADRLLTQAGSETISRSATNGLISGTGLGALATSTTYTPHGEVDAFSASHNSSSLYQALYTRDAVGRITTETETVGGSATARSYSYDPDGELVDVIAGGQTVAHYDYDANGNRLTKTTPTGTVTASFNEQDQLTSQGALQFTYTKDGDLATRTDTATGQVTRLSHDGFSNLTGVELPDGRQVSYVIDPAGRRVGKKIDGQLQHGFLYGPEAQGPIAQLDAQGNVTARFVYGTRSHVPDYLTKNGQTYALITDARGSPRLVVDTATGTVAQQLAYDEFGNATHDTSPGFQPFGFAGGLPDPDTGLIRFGARDYDPQTGRFTAKDPIGFDGGDTNLYAYVANDPVNLIDPDGTFAILPILAGGLLAAEVGITAHDINKLVRGCGNALDLALDAAAPLTGGLTLAGRAANRGGHLGTKMVAATYADVARHYARSAGRAIAENLRYARGYPQRWAARHPVAADWLRFGSELLDRYNDAGEEALRQGVRALKDLLG